jgi:hypothetical protein
MLVVPSANAPFPLKVSARAVYRVLNRPEPKAFILHAQGDYGTALNPNPLTPNSTKPT